MPKDDLISRHIFLLPFKWEAQDAAAELRQIISDSSRWAASPFEIQDAEAYNNYTYFLNFTRYAIFDQSQAGGYTNIDSFQYQIPVEDPKIRIAILNRTAPDYELRVGKITLEIYPTQVAILSIELDNYTYHDPEDILQINQFTRRLYPPFLPLIASKGGEFPHQISFSWDKNLSDDFSYFEDFAQINRRPTPLPRHILGLIIPLEAENQPEIEIIPTIDDRMFVISWYGNDQLSVKFSQKKAVQNWQYMDKEDRWWYRYVFVDGGEPTMTQHQLFDEVLTHQSYLRWVGSGTLYGITRYSFVVLTDEGYFGRNLVSQHTRDHYYNLAKLVLIQRASLIKFSEDLTRYSLQAAKEVPAISQIKKWHRDYQYFLSQIIHGNVSAQDQGIELYEMTRKAVDIEDLEKKLLSEINEMKNYAQAYEEERKTEAFNIFTVLGMIFTFFSFLSTFQRSYYFKRFIDRMGDVYPIYLFILFLISAFFVYQAISQTVVLKETFLKNTGKFTLALLFIIGALLFPLLFQ